MVCVSGHGIRGVKKLKIWRNLLTHQEMQQLHHHTLTLVMIEVSEGFMLVYLFKQRGVPKPIFKQRGVPSLVRVKYLTESWVHVITEHGYLNH